MSSAPLPVALAPQRLRPHSPFPLSRQPAAGHSPATLPASPRSGSAANPTTSLHRQGNQTALALSQLWRAHGGHRETYRRPTPTPLATLSLRSRSMKQPFPALSLGAPHHPQACRALLAPKPAVRSQPRPKIPFPPYANSHPTNPRLALAGSTSCSPSFSPNPRTIE